MIGRMTTPRTAPAHQYRHHMHTGSPSGGRHPVMPSTTFPISIAIMPPPKRPTIIVKQPTPIYGQTLSSGAGSACPSEPFGPVIGGEIGGSVRGELPRYGNDVRRLRKNEILELRRVRQRHVVR